MKSTKKCKWCKEQADKEFGIQTPAGFFCSYAHVIEYTNDKQRKQREKAQKRVKVERKRGRTVKAKELRTRSDWYNRLGTLVNQYVRWRDRDEPCCTCGTTNPNIKYDAGHFHTKKARPDIRFELTNIHKQCSMRCNVHGSGMRNEYEKFIIEKYGAEHLAWLELEKRPLFDVFPNWQDIEDEIDRYRKLLRSVGVTPNI